MKKMMIIWTKPWDGGIEEEECEEEEIVAGEGERGGEGIVIKKGGKEPASEDWEAVQGVEGERLA